MQPFSHPHQVLQLLQLKRDIRHHHIQCTPRPATPLRPACKAQPCTQPATHSGQKKCTDMSAICWPNQHCHSLAGPHQLPCQGTTQLTLKCESKHSHCAASLLHSSTGTSGTQISPASTVQLRKLGPHRPPPQAPQTNDSTQYRHEPDLTDSKHSSRCNIHSRATEP